jgi:hypothetical protein
LRGAFETFGGVPRLELAAADASLPQELLARLDRATLIPA